MTPSLDPEPFFASPERGAFHAWATACGEGRLDPDQGLLCFADLARADSRAASMFCEILWSGSGAAAAVGAAMEMILARVQGTPGISLVAREFEEYGDEGQAEKYWGWAQDAAAWSQTSRAHAMKASGAEVWPEIGVCYLIHDMPAPLWTESSLSADEVCAWALSHAKNKGFSRNVGGMSPWPAAQSLEDLWKIAQAGLVCLERSEIDAAAPAAQTKRPGPRI